MKRIPTLLCAASLCVIAAEAQNEGDGIRRTTKLPEVTVRLKPVEQVGDTIKYNVSAFQGKDDHYLEDVLKKMPGIQVSPNGTILYKGETINQFNIEGQNLLGNRITLCWRHLRGNTTPFSLPMPSCSILHPRDGNWGCVSTTP